MKRRHIEHILRAAANITGEREIIVIGSQAALIQFDTLPDDLTRSNDADLYPRENPEKADDIEGAIGFDSPFHQQFGYYADAVGPESALLPSDWETRAVTLNNANTGAATGVAPEIHDLAVSKLLAGREKDGEWVRAAVKHKFVSVDRLLRLIPTVKTETARIEQALSAAKAMKRATMPRQLRSRRGRDER